MRRARWEASPARFVTAHGDYAVFYNVVVNDA
jgi:hypothetical protein